MRRAADSVQDTAINAARFFKVLKSHVEIIHHTSTESQVKEVELNKSGLRYIHYLRECTTTKIAPSMCFNEIYFYFILLHF